MAHTGESSYVTASSGGQDGGGDGCVMASDQPMASSSHEYSRYHTAGMSEEQIRAAIENSREQGWSELADTAPAAATGAAVHGEDTRVLWEQLKKTDSSVFQDDDIFELGRQIAEGGQAHIYEVQWKDFGEFFFRAEFTSLELVAKVLKMEGFSLADLQRHWPLVTKSPPVHTLYPRVHPFVLGRFAFGEIIPGCTSILRCTFLPDGRFAFISRRCWGDLRTLINLKVSENNSQGPLFPHRQALQIMRQIAHGMTGLHSRGVLHRDLKAANILISSMDINGGFFYCEVADYETSMLVQGTGFWRAPEVLKELLKKPCDRNVQIWTEKVDVYSYGMTCYEVLTGHVPFFGYVKSDWKRVIDGERPHLPNHIDVNVRKLVEACWHIEPSERPTFEVIENELLSMIFDVALPNVFLRRMPEVKGERRQGAISFI